MKKSFMTLGPDGDEIKTSFLGSQTSKMAKNIKSCLHVYHMITDLGL